MSSLACPKCRLALSDGALDAGECPCCGYDGPAIVATDPRRAWLIATAAVVVSGAAVSTALLLPQTRPPVANHEPVAVATAPALPLPPAVAIPVPQPQPPESKKPAPVAPPPAPYKPAPPDPEQKPPPDGPNPPKPNPWIIWPKPEPPRPKPFILPKGPIERIDAKAVREKAINDPRVTLLVADLTRDDRLTLTGKVRSLRLGSVSGKAVLDASGLEAEEIVITGDISDSAEVKLNAPGGTVGIGGHVVGTAKLTVTAPGGRVTIIEKSGKLVGHAEVKITAKLVEMKGTLAGNAKLIVNLTDDGAYKLTGKMEEKATATINK